MKGLIFGAAALASLFAAVPAIAQNIVNIMEQMAEAGASADDAEDYLQQYSVLDLNLATRSELLSSTLFSPFQIESLLDYRAEYGALLSAAELALVDGFSKEFCDSIEGRITLGSGTAAETSLQARSRYKFKGGTPGVHQYNRLLMRRGLWQGALLAESDAGEKPLIDHIGGYLAYEKGHLKFIAGDYSACFGQGAALWSAFAFSGAGIPASLLRHAKGITPYKSADENRALRGAAATLLLGGGWEATVLLSATAVDAKVTDEGYTSISKTGLHRTVYEKSCRNAMREYLAGANLTRRSARLYCGITAVVYGYNRRNARKAEPYNQLQMYDGLCGNISADALLSLGHWRLSAEAALGKGLRPAAVAAAVYSPSYSFEAALHLRYYHKGYIAPHAGSYSSISSVSNQTGAVLSLLWRPLRPLTLTSLGALSGGRPLVCLQRKTLRLSGGRRVRFFTAGEFLLPHRRPQPPPLHQRDGHLGERAVALHAARRVVAVQHRGREVSRHCHICCRGPQFFQGALQRKPLRSPVLHRWL